MIVVYPMVVSNSISENTLPAISKMIENYIIVFMQNDFMSAINGKYGGHKPKLSYKIKQGKIVGESINLVEAKEDLPKDTGILAGTKRAKQKYKDIKNKFKKDDELEKLKGKSPEEVKKNIDISKEKRERQKWKAEKKKSKEDKKSKAAKVSVRASDRTISLEPSWVEVHTDDMGTQFVGVKVVPYRVNSDVKLSHLLMHDMKLRDLDVLTLSLGRKLLGKILRISRPGGTVTGDPKRDIIYRTTGQQGETFVALEKNNDIDEYFLQNTNRINRLFKLGWGNFVIADDALQIAHFCMRANKGICQSMNYRMMYKTLGQSGVYEDLEDARKQNSSLFKMKKTRFSKLLGESKTEEKLFIYQER